MKKSIFILSFLLLLCSCSSSKERLVIEKNDYISSFVQLSSSQFISSFESNKDLVVYIGNEGCSSCAISHTYIENYISATKYMIYFITSEDYQLIKDTLNLPSFESSSLLFIQNSEVKDVLSYSKKIYSSQPSFNNELGKRISSSYIKNVNDFTSVPYASWNNMHSFDFSSTQNLNNITEETAILVSKTYSLYPNEEYKDKLMHNEIYSFMDINNIIEDNSSIYSFNIIDEFYIEIKKI
ncbi:MAG: hypothetical protein ACI4U5_00945 [Bacilli bacterium]